MLLQRARNPWPLVLAAAWLAVAPAHAALTQAQLPAAETQAAATQAQDAAELPGDIPLGEVPPPHEALALAQPLQALAGNIPVSGIWRGTLGKQEIIACFSAAGTGDRSIGEAGSGNYYDLRRLVPVPLVKQEGAAQWQERGGMSENSANGSWVLNEFQGDSLGGEQRDADGANPQPISLHRVDAAPTRRPAPGTPAGGETREYRACGNDAYIKPLQQKQQSALGRLQLFFDMPYRRRTMSLAAVSSTVSTIELVWGTSQASAINGLLRKAFLDDVAFLNECNRDSLERTGFGGAPTTEVRPVFLSTHFITLRHARDAVGCSRKDDWRYATYDFTSGTRLDINSWFSVRPSAAAAADDDDAAPARKFGQLLRGACQAAARKAMVDDPGCTGSFPNARIGFKGMLFEAEGPNHDTVEIEYGQILPFLTPRGLTEVKLLISTPGQGNSRFEF